jgi:uncharacterized protein (DUF2249 family)
MHLMMNERNPMLIPTANAIVDVREIAPAERHPHIFSVFGQLATGEFMELVNDHDPQPLHRSFQMRMAGQFNWDYLEKGPVHWRVAITRVATAHDVGRCCGGCGGA